MVVAVSVAGKVCVVTGASSGIGAALAVAFARAGADVWALGRNRERLESMLDTAGGSGRVAPLVADLEREEDLESARREILAHDGRVDVLVHSAGSIARGPVESAQVEDFDRQYRVNLRAPFVLTRALLPALKRSRGQVVFINSSAGLPSPSPDAALYAATKHGLKAFADSLRQEVNVDGIRVATVYPGRTATPMQESVHEHEGRPYRAEYLMRSEDVVDVVLAVLALGPTAEITDVNVRPMSKLPESEARAR